MAASGMGGGTGKKIGWHERKYGGGDQPAAEVKVKFKDCNRSAAGKATKA